MTPEQFERLIKLIEKMSSPSYTITGAQDWPILVVVGAILLAAIALMWADLKSLIKDNKIEWKDQLTAHVKENTNDLDDTWEEIRRCQANCCDFGGRRRSDAKHDNQ
jgi:hypothetical protein